LGALRETFTDFGMQVDERWLRVGTWESKYILLRLRSNAAVPLGKGSHMSSKRVEMAGQTSRFSLPVSGWVEEDAGLRRIYIVISRQDTPVSR
jgi:hypothetical protein